MRNVGIARSAELIVVAFRGDFESAPHGPGIFRRPVGSQLFEKLFQAGVELPLGPVPVKLSGILAGDGMLQYTKSLH